MRKTDRPPDSDAPTAGFLVGIFHRLLCGNHSRFSETCDSNFARNQTTVEKISKPSVVARLMGLESMVESASLPPPISRSRSVNSLGDWPQLLSQKHRRNRTCSFRETPVFLQRENEDFLLLSFKFDDGDDGFKKRFEESDNLKRESVECRIVEEKIEAKPKVSRRRAAKAENNGVKQSRDFRKIRNSSKTERWVLPSKKDNLNLNPKSKNKAAGSVKAGKKKKVFPDGTAEKLESLQGGFGSNCSSENSSPVSVLDHPFEVEETELQHIESIPHDCDSRIDWRLKLSSDSTSSEYPSDQLTINVTSISDKDDLGLFYKEDEKPPVFFSGKNRELELWSGICRLTQEEIKNVKWILVERGRLEYAETIGIEVGLQILDHLLQETLDELVCISQQQFLKKL